MVWRKLPSNSRFTHHFGPVLQTCACAPAPVRVALIGVRASLAFSLGTDIRVRPIPGAESREMGTASAARRIGIQSAVVDRSDASRLVQRPVGEPRRGWKWVGARGEQWTGTGSRGVRGRDGARPRRVHARWHRQVRGEELRSKLGESGAPRVRVRNRRG